MLKGFDSEEGLKKKEKIGKNNNKYFKAIVKMRKKKFRTFHFILKFRVKKENFCHFDSNEIIFIIFMLCSLVHICTHVMINFIA